MSFIPRSSTTRCGPVATGIPVGPFNAVWYCHSDFANNSLIPMFDVIAPFIENAADQYASAKNAGATPTTLGPNNQPLSIFNYSMPNCPCGSCAPSTTSFLVNLESMMQVSSTGVQRQLYRVVRNGPGVIHPPPPPMWRVEQADGTDYRFWTNRQAEIETAYQAFCQQLSQGISPGYYNYTEQGQRYSIAFKTDVPNEGIQCNVDRNTNHRVYRTGGVATTAPTTTTSNANFAPVSAQPSAPSSSAVPAPFTNIPTFPSQQTADLSDMFADMKP